jgi:hypothetical protein
MCCLLSEIWNRKFSVVFLVHCPAVHLRPTTHPREPPRRGAHGPWLIDVAGGRALRRTTELSWLDICSAVYT